MMSIPVFWRALRKVALLGAALIAGASVWAAQDAATQSATQQAVIDAISAGRDASALLQNLDSRAGGNIAARNTTGKQLAQALATLSAAVNAGDIAGIKLAHEQVRASAMLVQSDSQDLKAKLADPSLPSAFEARRAAVQAQLEQLLQQLTAAVAALDGDADQQTQALTALRQTLQATSQGQGSAPVLRAALLPVRPLALAARAPLASPAIIPSYEDEQDASADPEDLADSPEAPLNDEILAKTQELGYDYVRIYEYVRNNVRSQWYTGSVKGALGVLRTGSGNAVDQASLLIAMLRAAGAPARYVQGVAEVSVEAVANTAGLADPSLVPDLLAKAGIAYTPVVQGGRVALVRIEHTWVAVQVPYTNYRGIVLDATGKTWLPLDVFYKTLQPAPGGASLSGLGLDWQSLLTQYRSAPQDSDFGAYLRAQVIARLPDQSSPSAYDDAVAPAPIKPQTLGLLPNTLAFSVVAVTAESAALPAALQGSARIRVFDDAAGAGNAGLDITLPIHQLFNQRATINYIPAELADHRAILAAGGLDLAPVYLFQLRPELRLDGFQRSVGLTPLAGGSAVKFRLDIQTPASTQSIEQSFLVGAYHAIGVGQSGVARSPTPSPSDSEYDAARLLDGIIQRYEAQWSDFEAAAAQLSGAAIVRPAPSVTIVSNALNAYSVNGVPYTLEWKGVTIDAAAHPTEVAAASGARDLLTAIGLAGSSLEHNVFKSQFGVDSISADKLIALARAQDIDILALTSPNAPQLAALPLPDAARADLQSFLQLGYNVEIPAQGVTYNAWSGAGWIVSDPATGASGYYLSGGIAGGATTEEPWTLQFLADILAAAHGDEPNNDPSSGVRVEILNADADLRGTVGQTLTQPFSVRVLDKDGRPVKGASVNFLASRGGGNVNPASGTTNVLGVATATITLGQSTGASPVYIMRNSDDTYSTQVGLNIFDATVASSVGTLKPESPLSALALPDVPAVLNTKQVREGSAFAGMATVETSYSVEVLDQYANPVANVTVSGVGLSPSANCDPPVPLTPATVDGPYKSDTSGVTFLTITPGPTNGTVSPVQVTAGNLSATIQVNVNYACDEYGDVFGLAWAYFDKDGQPSAATGVGKRYEKPFGFKLILQMPDIGWNSQHLCVRTGTRRLTPLTTASVTLEVSSGGNALGVASIGPGEWESYVITGPAPAKNELVWNANGTFINKYFNMFGTADSKCEIEYEQEQSFSERNATGAVFGVRASIGAITSVVDDASIDPTRLYLSDSGFNTYPIDIPFTIEPAEYKAPAVQMFLFENDQLIAVRPSTSKQQQGSAQIERGNRFDITKNYQASAYINDNIVSDRKDLPFKQRIVASYDKSARLLRDVDIANDRICEQGGQLDFVLSQGASLTLEAVALSDDDNNLVPVGSPVRLASQHFDVGAGSIALAPDALLPTKNGYAFTLTAVADKDGAVETNPGKIYSRLDLNDALPVGNILINGVNVKSGRLVLSGPGIGVAARGPQLAFRPAYSSSNSGAVGVLGINWSHNFDASLKTTACGDILINAGDGGFVRFLPAGDGTFTPARGYHGTLIPNFGDHSYDFYSKDGTRYHFDYVGGKRQWALHSIVDANGNALALTYDSGINAPLLRVANDYGQTLQLTYQSRVFRDTGGPVNVLQTVQGPDNVGLAFEYDDAGNLVAITRTDEPSFNESYSYGDYANPLGEANLLQSVTNALSQTTQFEYNSGPVLRTFGNGQINSFESTVAAIIAADTGKTAFAYSGTTDAPVTDVTDARGASTRYSFNKYGNPLAIDAPAGTTSMTWATDDVLMLSKVDANNVTTKYTYDANGNQTSEQVMGQGGASTAQTWLAQTEPPYIKSKRLSATDRNGNASTFKYDARGNLTDEYLPDGGHVSYAIATNGDVLGRVDALGNATQFHYEWRGLRTDVIAPIGTTTTAYDNRGRPVSITDAESRRTEMVYNTLDQLTDLTLAAGTPMSGKRHTDWDLLGNKVSETDEEGRLTSYRYDDMNRVVHKALPIGAVDTTWDFNGNKTSETNLRGDVTTYEYDPANRLIRRTEPATPAKVTQYEYDGAGNITLETDALGRQTKYTYNVLNQRTDTAYLNDHTATHADYDGNGNKVSETDEEGRVTTRVFDRLNRLTDQTIDTSAGPSHRHITWDRNGNKTSETDELGNTTSYEYDALGRLVKQTDALSKITNIDYDRVGNKLQITDPLRHARKWKYNARNWVEIAQDGESNPTQYSYDKVGNKLSETWPNGNTIQYDYDALNRQTASRDNLGPVSQATWDPDGNKTSETDGNGHAIAYEWDAIGRQKSRTQQTAAGPATTSTIYDAAGNPVTVTDPNGNATHTDYDERNRPVKVYDGIGTISQTTYDKVGNPIAVTDGRNRTLTHAYNELNLRVSTRDSLGQVETNTYDRHGNKIETTDANGNLTQYTYDALNRVTVIQRANIQIKKTDYDEAGNVQYETDGNGNKVGYEYDKRNLLVKTNRNLGAIDQLTRDNMGDVTVASDPEGRTTQTDYDKRRRPVQITDGESHATQNTYDLAGNLIESRPPIGAASGYDYDSANRLVKIRQPTEASRTYDKNGNLVSQTDFNGNSTSYTYDPRNRRTRKTLPGGAYETNDYDNADGLKEHQDANGNRFTHTLDIRGRRTNTTVSPTGANSTGSITNTAYTYDNNGNLTSTSQTDSNGTRAESTDYDAFDRPKKVTDAWGNSLTHGYDANGNRTSTSATMAGSAGGAVTSYGYDSLNRLTSQTGAGGTTQIGYDKSSKIIKITYPDGSSNSASYDQAGRVKTETASTSTTANAGNTIASTSYTYDANGNRIASQRTESLSQNNRSAELSATLPGGSTDNYTRARTESWAYDPQNRLTGHDTPERSIRWQLDAGGRRVQQTVIATVGTTGPPNPLEASTQAAGTTNYTYNERDQLTQVSGAQTASYTWDANGNRISQTKTEGVNTTTTNYRWNAQDQLIGVEQGSTPLASYRYNAANLRAEKILTSAGQAAATTGNASGNNPLAYERTQWDGLHARRSFEVAGTNQTLRSDTDAALFGQDAAPLLLNRTDYANGLGSASSTTQLLTDANGTLIATVIDDGGAKADSLLLYSPYGLIDTEASGNGATALQSNGNSFGSYYADPETGLLYARARYYDPASGQFISRDPMEGEDRLPITWGAYQYGGYNPYRFTDPTGQYLTSTQIQEKADALAAAETKGQRKAVEDQYAQINAKQGQRAAACIIDGKCGTSVLDAKRDYYRAVRNELGASCPPPQVCGADTLSSLKELQNYFSKIDDVISPDTTIEEFLLGGKLVGTAFGAVANAGKGVLRWAGFGTKEGVQGGAEGTLLAEGDGLALKWKPVITSEGTANAATGARLAEDLAAAQRQDPLIGTTLPGAKAPVTVTAESNIGGRTLVDTNQTARPIVRANPERPTLISDLVRAGDPNSTMANAHAEIGLIQQAYDAGLTQGKNMTILVRGEQICSYCLSDVVKAADRAGLNNLEVVDAVGNKTYTWVRGTTELMPKK